MENIRIEFLDNLPKEMEEKISRGFIEYETEHGIDVNYKKFSIILTTEGGDLLGALNAFTSFAEVYVDDIWVDKHHRGKGYGRRLLEALESHFKGKGFNNINLVTNAFQAPEFYQKCGYSVEFIRKNVKNPSLSKTFFIKHFEDETQMQGIKI